MIEPNERVIPFAPEQGQPFGVLHGHIKYIAVKKPRLLAVELENELVQDFKIPCFEPYELTKDFIVVPRDVIHGLLACNHIEQFAQYLHVRGWEVLFLELPHIDDIAIQNQYLRINGAQVLQNFERPAAAHAQMQVGKDRHFNRASRVSRWGKGHVRICTAGLSCALPLCVCFVMILRLLN